MNALPAAAHVVVNAGSGGHSASTVELTRSGNDLDIYVDATLVKVEPLSKVDSVEIDTGSAPTTVEIDFSGGDPIPAGGIQIQGSDPNSGSGTTLVIEPLAAGAPFNDVTYVLGGNQSGSIELTGPGQANTAMISFSGVSQIVDLSPALDRDILLTAPGAGLILAPATDPGTGATLVTTTIGESLTLTNPLVALNVEASAASDTLNLVGLGIGFDAQLSLGGFSVVQVSGETDLGGGSLSITANEIDIDAALDSTGVAANLIAQQQITLGPAGGIEVGSGGSITIQAPQITEAGFLSASGGRINLNAGSTGTLLVSGSIDASDLRAGAWAEPSSSWVKTSGLSTMH